MALKDWDAQHRLVPREELPSLAIIHDADQRLFLRFYLRSNIEKDQDEAKKRCETWGIDYAQARDEARRDDTMTEEQVATAIVVLTAYADGTLRTDQCDELDAALIKAYQVWEEAASLEFEGDPEEEQYTQFGYAGELDDE